MKRYKLKKDIPAFKAGTECYVEEAGHNLLSMISFDGFVFNCVDGKYYTIDELCGEGE